MAVSFNLNGRTVQETVPAQQVLADFLIERGVAGVRVSCDQGVCGACTALVDGCPIATCAAFVFQVDGCDVVTVEGLSDSDDLHPMQRSFVDRFAMQCGYCTPGMVLTAVALLNRKPDPSPDDVRRWLAGNVCRCTGYASIVDAVLDAARRRHDLRERT
ncbi:MAG: 2Fe-2S iron-sulfur cluster binding domain-containing protein [Actinophytocola sp.]|nr:2Fe-2S iron-sulfur cluster binding domain-containing protein [Actinophytocola sp.]